jgi:hypothetical protein
MPDNFTKVTTKGYGQRIKESIGGVVMAVVLFFGSFGVLFWNEGRVDLSGIAKNAQIVSSDTVDASKDGMFISTSGKILGSEDIGDDMYLKPGEYLLVSRSAEAYAWVEEEELKTQTNTGGSETTTATYNYKKEWVSIVPDSSAFEYPEGHENYTQTQENGRYRPAAMSVGAYTFDGQTVDISGGESLSLTAARVNLPSNAAIQGSYIYLDGADPAAPVVGDERVSFSVLKEGFSGTVFAEADGAELVRYTDEDGNTLFRVFKGGRDEVLATMHGEYSFMLWVIRLVGFLMMWFGMQAIIAPLSVFLDILPFLGGASRAVTGGVTFLIALVLSAVTIVVSVILHSVVALIVVAALIIGAILFLRSRKNTRPVAAVK